MNEEIKDLIAQINKDAKDIIISIGEIDRNIPRIPFSSPLMNWMTEGGVPIGRFTQFAGENKSGKTTSAMDILQRYQKSGDPRPAMYIDAEFSLDKKWAEKLGVNFDELILMEPYGKSAEAIFDYAARFIRKNAIGLIILDSLGILLPEQIYGEEFDQNQMGGIAKALKRFSSEMVGWMSKYNITGIFTNQVIQDFNNQWNDFIFPGGEGWRHNYSMNIVFRKGQQFDKDGNNITSKAENPVEHYVEAYLEKTKVGAQTKKKARYTLNYNTGIAVVKDTVEAAIQFGIIKQQGAWFTPIDMQTGELLSSKKAQGRNNLYKQYQENQEDFDLLWKTVNEEALKND